MQRRRKGRDPAKRRGAQRMRDKGFHQVVLWLDVAEVLMYRQAAAAMGLPLATWMRRAAQEWFRVHGAQL